jgi:hypothetical protein
MKPYTIETANGVYKLKRPVGRIGMIHFSIMSKLESHSSEKDKNGNVILSPADQDRLEKAPVEWAEKVLKNILVPNESYLIEIDENGTEKKIGITYDDIPGEDQYLLFVAVSSKTNVDEEEPFRFI